MISNILKITLAVIALPITVKLYNKQKTKLHEENLEKNKRQRLGKLRAELNLNEDVIGTIFYEDKSYNFNKLNGFYDERKPIIRKLSKDKVNFYFEDKDKSVKSFLEINNLDLYSILANVPKLDDNFKDLERYDYETYKYILEEDIIFRDFISNRLNLYEKSKEYCMTTNKDLIDIQDYTQDILNNVIRFSQRRVNHNNILNNFKY